MRDFPRHIELKVQKCPSCGDALGRPALDTADATLRVVCRKDGCGYAIDVGWLGGVNPN